MKEFILSALSLIFLIIFVLSFYSLVNQTYCYFNPSYFQNDMCYDENFRCEIECGVYKKNYTGHIKSPCSCDCGDSYVDICTGTKRDKEIIGDLI